jgi:Concanavalin A-like lectin/glucanases superfamily
MRGRGRSSLSYPEVMWSMGPVIAVAACACGRFGFVDDRADAAHRDSAGDVGNVGDVGLGDTPLTYRDVVLADLPTAYWRLGDLATTAHDELGNNDGTYTGNCARGIAGAIAGDSDTAIGFDGTSCMVTLPNAFGFMGTQPFSIEAWVSPSAGGVQFQHVFTHETRSAGPDDGYALLRATDVGIYIERVVATAASDSSVAVVANSAYAHVVAVYDGAANHLYVDGAEVGAPQPDVGVLATISVAALIGASSQGNFFAGAIDEVAVYGHALSLPRIALHHHLGAVGH